MDVFFNVPGELTVPAGVTGFGAVFTDVDRVSSTRMQFFAPDGALLFERDVPSAQGNKTQSFLGVSFDKGEIVGRVHIVSGNAAPGPEDTGALDLVAMDDFIYGEPVSTKGLVISPSSGPIFQSGSFDLVIGVDSETPRSTLGSRSMARCDRGPRFVLQRGRAEARRHHVHVPGPAGTADRG